MSCYLITLILAGAGSKVNNITVFNNVLLTLLEQLTIGLNSGFVAKINEVLVLGDLSQNKGVHEIVVNDTSGLRSLGTNTDGPLSDLVGTGGKEGAEVQGGTHGGDDLGQGALDAELLELLLALGVGLHVGQTFFEADGEWDDQITGGVGINPLLDAEQMLVLLADVVALGQVDEVDTRLGGQQQHGVDGLNLLSGPGAIGNTLAGLKVLQEAANKCGLILLLLDLERLATALDDLLDTLEVLLDELNVLNTQFVEDDLQVANGVDVALNVDDFGVVKASDDLENSVNGTNVGQKSVSETLTLGGTLG